MTLREMLGSDVQRFQTQIDDLLIGLPIALAVRGLLEGVGWVLGVAIR